MLTNNLLILLTARVVFCLEDQLAYMPPPARVYSEDTYTLAVLNSTYPYAKQSGERYEDKSDSGRFADNHIAESKGILIHVVTHGVDDPHSGCYLPWKASYGEIPKNESWIALVKKGKCNSHVKAQNAYNSNASGVIIYSDKPTSLLEKIRQVIGVPKNFSVVSAPKWKGEELYEQIDNGTTVRMHISIGEEITRTAGGNVNKTSVLFVSISFMILMMVSIGWIIFYYVQKCRYLHAKDRLSKRLSSAAKKALQKIPTRHIKADEKDVGSNGCGVINESCAICIELFKPADVVRLLPCRHEFHKLCIDPWLLEHRTCPMCKMDILKYFGFELTGSQESMLRIDQDDPFHDIFFFTPDPQNISTIVETSAIVPVSINHYPRIEVDNRPSTSQDASTPTLSRNHPFSTSIDTDSRGLRVFRNSNILLNPALNGFDAIGCSRGGETSNVFPSIISSPIVDLTLNKNIANAAATGVAFGTVTTTSIANAAGLRRSVSFSDFDYISCDGQI